MKFGIFTPASPAVLRPFPTEEQAQAFLPCCSPDAYVAPIKWELDAKYIAGGHFVEVM